MSDERDEHDEHNKPKRDKNFFSRWSRLKTEEARPQDSADAQVSPAEARNREDGPVPDLPSLDTLTIDSDYSDFFHPKVDENLRRGALKKLFADPHFNVMDGLDTYIDDYSKSDPLPPEMLAQLKHGQQILAWAREKPRAVLEAEQQAISEHEQTAIAEDTSMVLEPGPVAEPTPVDETVPNELRSSDTPS